MLAFYVLFKAHGFVIECGPIQATYETSALQSHLFILFFASQVGERIDNHTENQVKYNNDDDEEE